MRNRVAIIFVLIILVLCSVAWAQQSETAVAPPLVVDSPDGAALPANFRTMSGGWKRVGPFMPSAHGLENLRASGSAQFSAGELQAMLPFLDKKVIIVDLRQESHGFLNGAAVSWYGAKNWANRGKTREQVLADEASRLDGLRAVPATDVVTFGPHHTIANRELATVGSVLSEAQVAAENKLGYFRITATDHVRPADADVDGFVRFVRQLPGDAWLHFHCRAGHGRTTTFLVLYDILRNGKTVPLADIVRRQFILGGTDLLADQPAKEGWEQDAYRERAEFISLFYRYVTTSPEDQPVSWSEWVKTHKP